MGFRRRSRRGSSRGANWVRIIIGLAVAGFALISYFGSAVENPVTGEEQYISITQEQEIALGLQAAPRMAQQFEGLDPDEAAQARIDEIGSRLVSESFAAESDYPFDFHLLADEDTLNALALPGGQIFITQGLLERLETEGQLAGILAHEIGHVIGRHGAEHMAKQRLTQGLTGALVLATYDPDDPSSQQTAQVAALIGSLVNMKFSREDELESDNWGVEIMAEAGYDPRSLVDVMRILAEAGGDQRPPEFFSTHPNPENRIREIQEAINQLYPEGVPEGLQP
ncbi:MAG: M48 family metalloprotease [Anaerolineales bacterium]